MVILLKRTFAVITLAAGAMLLVLWLTRSHESDVLLSSGVALTPEWQKITPPRMLLTEEPWSEILIDMPGIHYAAAGTRLLLDDGTSLIIDAYLVTEDAKEIKLDQVNPEGFGEKVILSLSATALQWKKRDYRFRAVALRSNRPVQTGKVLWISYDPRETKDGMASPRFLQ